MKIRNRVVATGLAAGLLMAVCTTVYAIESKGGMEHPGAERHKAKPPMEKTAAMTQSVYVCPDCEMTSLKPGKCACGKELVQRHLLGVKDGKAMVCDCPAECKCDARGVKDGKCACGKEVKMANCKGMYCCPKGCPEISKKPGKCACGMEMKKCE